MSPLPCGISPLGRTASIVPQSAAGAGVRSAATTPSSALSCAPSSGAPPCSTPPSPGRTSWVSCTEDFARPPERSDSLLTIIRPSLADIFMTASERSTIGVADALLSGILVRWQDPRASRGSRSSSSSSTSAALSATRGIDFVAFFFLRARGSLDTSSSEVQPPACDSTRAALCFSFLFDWGREAAPAIAAVSGASFTAPPLATAFAFCAGPFAEASSSSLIK
ncbi:hypothetical protein Taro_035674 [Colocasia esculenta]|uniref:Uncharacterized protein n=1 Tax=Colocasia esculenta TaxID=4460 RepID=A0A843VV57_COLES|nr:hypothetical protein [Colocasia esculenta]